MIPGLAKLPRTTGVSVAVPPLGTSPTGVATIDQDNRARHIA